MSTAPAPIEVLHADASLVVVNKPVGLAVHRSHMTGAEPDFLIALIRAQTGRTLQLAHRLDRATSGVLVLAGDREVAGELGRQFMAQTVQKRYLAVVRGHVADEGTIDHALDAPGKPVPQPAVTHFRCLARVELPIPLGRYESVRYSLVEARPESGRYRQIRRHFKHASHHLIGDTSHGEGRHNRFFRIRYAVHRMLLHASSVSLRHPVSGEPITFSAPLDPAFLRVIDAFGWREALPAPL